jgi:Fe-S cluster assembly iron-binding protein IscA
MLALTEDAQQAIGGILEQADPGAGIRIAPGAGADNAGALQMTVAPAPDTGDEVIESEGGPVFVDEAASTYLDDKVLDANVEQGQVQFELVTKAA